MADRASATLGFQKLFILVGLETVGVTPTVLL